MFFSRHNGKCKFFDLLLREVRRIMASGLVSGMTVFKSSFLEGRECLAKVKLSLNGIFNNKG